MSSHSDAQFARNPHLPPAPADGQHQFGDEPTDIGGNRRCKLCGAYRGSDEATRTCVGEYAESGKMRSWADERWLADRLSEGGTARAIVVLTTRKLIGVRDPGIHFDGEEAFHITLECGHDREIDYDAAHAVRWHTIHEAACVAKHCPMAAREASRELNSRNRAD